MIYGYREGPIAEQRRDNIHDGMTLDFQHSFILGVNLPQGLEAEIKTAMRGRHETLPSSRTSGTR